MIYSYQNIPHIFHLKAVIYQDMPGIHFMSHLNMLNIANNTKNISYSLHNIHQDNL